MSVANIVLVLFVFQKYFASQLHATGDSADLEVKGPACYFRKGGQSGLAGMSSSWCSINSLLARYVAVTARHEMRGVALHDI